MSEKKKCGRAIDDKGLENVSGGIFKIEYENGKQYYFLYNNSGIHIKRFPRTIAGYEKMLGYAKKNNIKL